MSNRALVLFGTLLARISARALPREMYRGFELLSFVGKENRDILRQKVGEGLDVIEAYDPKRMGRIAHDVKRFVAIGAGGDHYSPALKAHMVDVTRLGARSNAQMALNIVHEAAHARLHQAGIRSTPQTAARIERLCVKEEIALARHLPGCDGIIEHLKKVLDKPWWTPDQARARADERLRSVRVPRCARQLLLALIWGRRVRSVRAVERRSPEDH